MHPFGPTLKFGSVMTSKSGIVENNRLSSMYEVQSLRKYQTTSSSRVPFVDVRAIDAYDTTKMFRVVDANNNYVFSRRVSKADCLIYDVEWLYNEYLKARIMHVGNDVSVIPCLKSVNNNLNLDSLLTKPGTQLSAFPDLLDLEPYYMEPNKNIEFSSFKVLGLIGKGTFSQVFVVRKKDSGDIYAMKAMKKDQFIRRDKEEYIFREKDILTSADHPNIVNKSDFRLVFITSFRATAMCSLLWTTMNAVIYATC